jgi:hypothetical protein
MDYVHLLLTYIYLTTCAYRNDNDYFHSFKHNFHILIVDDVNLALSLNGLEEIYGLCPSTASIISSEIPAVSTVVNLLDFAKQPIPKCPLLPEFSLHWLAVDGYQPLISENPSSATVTAPNGMTNIYICIYI